MASIRFRFGAYGYLALIAFLMFLVFSSHGLSVQIPDMSHFADLSENMAIGITILFFIYIFMNKIPR